MTSHTSIGRMYPTENIQKKISNLYEFYDLYNKEGLYPHQEFVRRFMSPHTPYKSILLYHSPGSGKSMISISISVDHYIHSSIESFIITKGESGSNSFKKQINQYIEMSSLDPEICSIFKMDHYLSLHNRIVKYSDEDIVKRFDKKIITLDEIHNIREIGNEAKVFSVYRSMRRIIRMCPNSKFIFCTATPMVDSYEQIKSIRDLLSNELETRGFISFNSRVQEKPRIRYIGIKNDSVIPRIELVKMVGHQRKLYLIEASTHKVDDIYKKLTHMALFIFPNNGECNMIETRNMATVVPFDRKKSPRDIIYNSFQVPEKMKKFLTGENLRRSSCKYHRLIHNIEKSKGSIFISMEEIMDSGIILLSNILEMHGYELYYGQPISTKKKRYTVCAGSLNISPNMQERLDAFNDIENKDGSMIQILLGSRVIGESITLLNVRQFHSMSPHWNYSKLNQAIGRVIRSRSHSALRNRDREVEIYVYIADESVDVLKLKTCKRKQVMIKEQEEILRERSIEKFSNNHDYDGQEKTDNFILFYMDSYMKVLIEKVREIFFSNDISNFENICRNMNYPIPVIKEVLLRIVVNNIEVRDGLYLREDSGIFFLNDNPSSPFCTLLHPQLEDKTMNRMGIDEYDTDINISEAKDPLDYLRICSVSKKIVVLEYILAKRNNNNMEKEIKRILKYLFITVDNKKYHILCYRKLDKAYRAVIPIPNKSSGAMRYFDGEEWKYVEDISEEEEILDLMRIRLDKKLSSESHSYGIISVIDNRMRLRRGEDKKDKRKTLKGRTLDSMKKSDLKDICLDLSIDVNSEDRTDSLVDKIENCYIKNKKYMMI